MFLIHFPVTLHCAQQVGDTVTGSEDGRTKVEANSNGNLLVISLAEAEDGGEYTCQLSALNTVELKHTVRVRGERTFNC